MDEYLVEGRTFAFDYQEMKRLFEMYEAMSDEDFLADLPNILHFTVFVCWFKRLPAKVVLSDIGVIHELVHTLVLVSEGKEPRSELNTWFADVRKLFRETCRLS